MLNSKARSRQINIATKRLGSMILTNKIKGPEAMTAFGHYLAQIIKTGDVIALEGGLGAGKSTLARGMIAAILEANGWPIDDIPSPTFTLVQSYPWADETDQTREIWHMDLWRLDGPDEVIELGFDEALGRHAMIIEWPDRMAGLLPPNTLMVSIETADGGDARTITLQSEDGSDWRDRLPEVINI